MKTKKLTWKKDKIGPDAYSWFATHKESGIDFNIYYGREGGEKKYHGELMAWLEGSDNVFIERMWQSDITLEGFVKNHLGSSKEELIACTFEKFHEMVESLLAIQHD